MKKITFLLTVLITIFFVGCKKNNQGFQNQKKSEQLKNDALDKLRQLVIKNPSLKKIKVPVGEKVDRYFADLSLNRVTSLARNPLLAPVRETCLQMVI